MIVPAEGRRYDKLCDELLSIFIDLDLNLVQSITLSGNSYGVQACEWIGKDVISQCTYLQSVNLGNIELSKPESCNHLFMALVDKQIVSIDLSGNPLGFNGAKSLSVFLRKSPRLSYVNLNNTLLGPECFKN